jgi:outer membrane immunogenic protein
MKRILLTAAIAASAVPALAADLPVKARPMPPPVVVYNWTGFYIGGNVGYSWGRATTDQTDAGSTTVVSRLFRGFTGGVNEVFNGADIGFPALGAFPQTTTTTAAGATSTRANVKGFIGGGQLGYNVQSGAFVYGIETDFQWSGEKGSDSICSVPGCIGGVIGTADHSLRWFGTLRGRLGVLPAERILLYATGGLAYGRIDSTYSSGFIGFPLLAASSSTTRLGWTVGAGVEGALDSNWTVKAEYLYMDLGSYGTNLGTGTVGPVVVDTLISPNGGVLRTTTTSTLSAAANSRFTDHIFRVGLNYRFSAGPVVARY